MDEKSSPDDGRLFTPLERWFRFLKHFDEVPLPDGRIFSQVDGKLLEKRGNNWERSDISVNDLIERISGLSTERWRALLSACSGDEEANRWREKLLNHWVSSHR